MKHPNSRRRALAAMAAAVAAGTAAIPRLAHAQAPGQAPAQPPGPAAGFPSRPIRVLVGFPAGGTQDTLVRTLAEKLRVSLGQPVVLENRPGAAGRIAVDLVKTAEPDGHAVLVGTAAMMSIYPSVYRRLSYDPARDFAPVVNAAGFSLAMVVPPSHPARNVREFIEWAKANRGKVSYASYSAGSPSHFLGDVLDDAQQLGMVHIPYKGSAPAQTDLIGGQVSTYFDTVGGAVNFVRTGKMRALATSGAVRAAALPDVPTFTEQGFPDMTASAWFGFYLPARTPRPIVERLNRAINDALALPDVRERLLAAGMEPIGGTPEQAADTQRADFAKWAAVVKRTGFSADE